MREVKFFDYPSIYHRFEEEFNAAFKDVCSRGAFILQRDLEEFETALADYLGVKHVLESQTVQTLWLLASEHLGLARETK